MACQYVTAVVQTMLPRQQCEWRFPLYPAICFALIHTMQSKVLPTVMPPLAALALLALSAVMDGAASPAEPGGSSAPVCPPNGAVLIVWWPVACTAWGSGLAPATWLAGISCPKMPLLMTAWVTNKKSMVVRVEKPTLWRGSPDAWRLEGKPSDLSVVRAQTRFVRYLHHLREGGQFPCNPEKRGNNLSVSEQQMQMLSTSGLWPALADGVGNLAHCKGVARHSTILVRSCIPMQLFTAKAQCSLACSQVAAVFQAIHKLLI